MMGAETNGRAKKGDVSNRTKFVQYNNDCEIIKMEGNFVDWNNLNIIHNNSGKQDFQDKSPRKDKNNLNFSTYEKV